MIITLDIFDILFAMMTIYFLTHVLILGYTGGPFQSSSITISYQDTDGTIVIYQAGLWDYIRFLTGAYEYDEESEMYRVRPSYRDAFVCPKCLSFWIGLIFYSLVAIVATEPQWLLMILPTSGFVTILDR